ncbi:hypothetical protein PVAND_016101 [Polypedilum vanderplanki]|uniref:Alkaline ceramidase n=1 Tax=Polypedilum vanderplanki TaxID=319348 RepID=A0A9J6BEG1_POLVA|nr:hypothetical protein PVAND_016101 [Polypedilum vanderplanki]
MFIDKEAIYKSLEWHSSPVDWCEPNYQILSYVAEFYNTFSCLIMVFVPPIAIYLFRNYAKAVNCGIQAIMFMLIVVGVTSMYFHGTLSLMGQLLDELSILWVYALGVCLYCPSKYIPKSMCRKKFSVVITAIALMFTVLSVWKPFVNAFAQMSLTIPIIYYVSTEIKNLKRNEKEVYKIGVKTLVMGITAVILWFNDRLFCEFYKSYGIIYLHAIWHILSFTASYYASCLTAYFFVKLEKPSITCEIAYWPNNCNFKMFCIPYVEIISDKKVKKKKN